MTTPWSASEPPAMPGLPGMVTLLQGSTFCISQSSGDILPGEPQGLFVQDTRVLSGWSLTIDGRPAEPLAVQQADPYAAAFLGSLPPPPGAPADAAMLVVRRRYIGDGMREDIAIRSTARMPARLSVTLTADADFADLFEVKAGLGALRIFDPGHPDRPVVAAGAPWFIALFGRDSLLTSWMLLPWDDSLAAGTLQTLADRQGHAVDRATEEEPGKILHEVRFGPAARLALGGRSVYYGTADATPLFVMLLGELRRWGRHGQLTRDLLPHADHALEWMQQYGDAGGDGFIEYSRKTPAGLANQGWKDSWDGINFADGMIAEPPIALAEVQGYAYAAYRARAAFAREAGDAPGARHWAEVAARLKHAFNHAFWLPDKGWYAVALDRRKRPVDALTSNIGHCLWTGIADADKAAAVADHLLSPDMFSGWGIRTLATSMTAYNPMSYHNGSVWPHDNALCAAGLMRYGFTAHAQRVAEAIFGAAVHFGYRLPELFCGFPRGEELAPIPYPTSCSPQAWAAATPLHLLTTLLRITPQPGARRLWCDPALPSRYLPFHAAGLKIVGSRLSIDIHDHGWQLTGLDGTGIELIRQPRHHNPHTQT